MTLGFLFEGFGVVAEFREYPKSVLHAQTGATGTDSTFYWIKTVTVNLLEGQYDTNRSSAPSGV